MTLRRRTAPAGGRREKTLNQADPISRLSTRSGLRLGIMGGAFDPIHIAHLVTAQEALVQFRLDEVVFHALGSSSAQEAQAGPGGVPV